MPKHRSVIVVVIFFFGLHQRLYAGDANAEWQEMVAAAKKEGKVVMARRRATILETERRLC